MQVTPPSSVLLLVGREEFTPPSSFGGRTCVSTVDCVAIAVADGTPVTVSLLPSVGRTDLLQLADLQIETEGLVSLRDVYSREHDNIGIPAGLARVVVWGDDDSEPTELVIEVTPVT